jgi:polygalacturonase
LRLKDNETLYIEGGAVVRGCIRATNAKNVRICGQGVLDGSYYLHHADGHRSIVLENCRDSRVEGIIMIEPSSWMFVLGACQNVVVSNVKELGLISGGDGLDIVGSKHIRVENCFFRNGDDCIVLKSLDLRGHIHDATLDFSTDVEDIEVVGCSLMTSLGGQIFEIGHELRTANIKDVHIHDCDVLEVRDFGAPFGIHNSDHATISNVLYEDIRVEHHYNKLIEFRIFESRWSRDKQRGQVRNITLRNIDVVVSEFNPGYTVSVIGGCDAEHTVDRVSFENFRMNGKPATSGDDIFLFTNAHASNISFR